MEKITLFIVSILFINSSFSQISFVEDNSNSLDAIHLGDVAFDDYDLDGDLDLFMTGINPSTSGVTVLYANDGNGNFTEVTGTPLLNLSHSFMEFVDLDNDGDNELFLFGMDNNNSPNHPVLYANNNGTYVQLPNTTFPEVHSGDVCATDVNNDGNLDILVSGRAGNSSITELIDNNGSQIPAPFSSNPYTAQFASAEFTDIDNDGDQDLLIAGVNANTQGSHINLYTNDGNGNFSLVTSTPFLNPPPQGFVVNFEISDIDNDNDTDVLVVYEGSSTKLYKNDGTGTLTEETGTTFPILERSQFEFTDIDNDGDDDVFFIGYNSGNTTLYSHLYLNNGSGNFSFHSQVSNGFDYGSFDIKDVNGDGKKDIFITGYTLDGSFILTSKLFLNTSTLSIQDNIITKVNLYPNPATNSFYIDNELNISKIIISNISGKIVKTFDKSLERYNINNLTSGLYFINIETESGKVSKKLLKK